MTKIVYNRKWDDKTTQLQIELSCYRHDVTEEQGGKGKFQHFKNAYNILYPELRASYFSWTEQMLKGFCEESKIGGGCLSILSGSGVGKSRIMSAISILDSLADPDNTISLVASTTLSDLNQRMWKYIKIDQQNLPFPFGNFQKTKPESILTGNGGLFTKSLDNDPEGETIKGIHPKRLRIYVDEGSAISANILTCWENWVSANKEFILVVLSNFRGFDNLCGAVSKPLEGWTSINYDNVTEWQTERGRTLLFDLTKSPVYKNPKLSEPGSPLAFIRSKKLIDETIYGVGKRPGLGLTHPRVMQYIRSIPILDEDIKTILNIKMIENAKVFRKPIWGGQGQLKLASLDPAFVVGGDDCILGFATLGYEQDGTQILYHEETLSIPLDSKSKDTTPFQIVNFTIDECEKRGILPENFILDACGTNTGIAYIFEQEWSKDINKIIASHGCSDEIVDYEFQKTAKEVYDRLVTQLWFQYRTFVEAGQILNIDQRAVAQFCSRLYDDSRTRIKLESKPDYKARIYGNDSVRGSPDEADMSTYMLHLAMLKGFELKYLPAKIRPVAEETYQDKINSFILNWHENKGKSEAEAFEASHLDYNWVGDVIGED